MEDSEITGSEPFGNSPVYQLLVIVGILIFLGGIFAAFIYNTTASRFGDEITPGAVIITLSTLVCTLFLIALGQIVNYLKKIYWVLSTPQQRAAMDGPKVEHFKPSGK